MDQPLPPIPVKRYFTIGEVGELCGVKPHVLRYWEQEFSQLRPMKRQGNRRYYQHHEVLMIRRIRELLYDQGFSIHGARLKLQQGAQRSRSTLDANADAQADHDSSDALASSGGNGAAPAELDALTPLMAREIASELQEIRRLLHVDR